MPKIDFQENQIIIKNNGLTPYTVTITRDWDNYTVKKNDEIVIQTNGEPPQLKAKNIFFRHYKGHRGDYFLSLVHDDTTISLWSNREITRWIASFRTPWAFYDKEIYQIADFLHQEHPVYQWNKTKYFFNQLKDAIILILIVGAVAILMAYHRDYIMILAERYEYQWN